MKAYGRRRWFLTGLMLFVFIAGFAYFLGGQSHQAAAEAQRTRFLMDTVVEIRAVGDNAEEAVNKAFSEIERVEAVFSRYVEGSEVEKINDNAGDWVTVSEETIYLIEQGIDFYRASGGVFDITIGQLVSLWGFGTDMYRVPNDEEVRKALGSIGADRIEIDRENNRVKIPSGTVLDLGGIAKGYAVDRAAAVLRQGGMIRGLINAGGDISAIGGRDETNPWRVGIQHPKQTSQILAVVPLKDTTVVTSGDYQRFFEKDGVRFHHIIDPRTGFPARGLSSVTIVAGQATTADALSTAVFILGWDDGQALVENLPEVEAVIVAEDGEIWVSSGLRDVIRVL